MGDEVQRSQQGNNNAYCQDNEVNWFQLGDGGRKPSILRFVKCSTPSTYLQHFPGRTVLERPGTPRGSLDFGIELNKPDFGYELSRPGISLKTEL